MEVVYINVLGATVEVCYLGIISDHTSDKIPFSTPEI